jgi:hypothetical protein
MGEEERFVYFQQLVENQGAAPGIEDVGGPTDFECERASGYPQSHALDAQEKAAIRNAGRNRLRDWLTSLRASLGGQLDATMENAVRILHDNKLRPWAGRWRPPQPLPVRSDFRLNQ